MDCHGGEDHGQRVPRHRQDALRVVVADGLVHLVLPPSHQHRQQQAPKGGNRGSHAYGAQSLDTVTNQTQEAREARVYSHNGPIGCRKRGYILTIGFAATVKVGLDTVTVELTVKTLPLRPPLDPLQTPSRQP
eukprot:197455-Prorocentrum_minimum.AAC.1